MSFTDLSVTWNTVAKTLPRISTRENAGDYFLTVTEGDLTGRLQHIYASKRTRRTARMDLSAVAADPLLTGVYLPVSMSAIMTVDIPKGNSISVATQKVAVNALCDWLQASTNLDRLLAGEN